MVHLKTVDTTRHYIKFTDGTLLGEIIFNPNTYEYGYMPNSNTKEHGGEELRYIAKILKKLNDSLPQSRPNKYRK